MSPSPSRLRTVGLDSPSRSAISEIVIQRSFTHHLRVPPAPAARLSLLSLHAATVDGQPAPEGVERPTSDLFAPLGPPRIPLGRAVVLPNLPPAALIDHLRSTPFAISVFWALSTCSASQSWSSFMMRSLVISL